MPSISETSSDPGWEYDYKRWDFLDFNFTYAGTTYNKSDLNYGFYYDYAFPATSYNYLNYGDFLKAFQFGLPSFWGGYADYAPNSIYSDAGFLYDYAGNRYVNSGTFQQVPASQVPTPALLPGLIGMGVVALRKRKSEPVEESVEESVAA